MNIRRILDLRWVLPQMMNKLDMRLRRIVYGRNFQSHGRILFCGKGRVKIGDDVTINSCLKSNPIGGASKTVFYSKEKGEIIVGNHVGISNSAIVALEKVEIGDDVFIGGNCKIYDHDFHSLDYSIRMLPGNQGVTAKPVSIGKGAFIGGHTIILKGVEVGAYAVIGAGSVVTRSVPKGKVWAGNPAVMIRKAESDSLDF